MTLILNITWIFLNVQPNTALGSDPCNLLVHHFARLANPRVYSSKAFIPKTEALHPLHQKMVDIYRSDLETFGKKIFTQRKGRPVRMVVYPFSGFDVVPMLLFPDATHFVWIDSGVPFLASRQQSQFFFRTETDIIKRSEAHWELAEKMKIYDKLLHSPDPDVLSDYARALFFYLGRGIGHINPDIMKDIYPDGMLPHFLGRMMTYGFPIRILEVVAFPMGRGGDHLSHGILTWDTGPDTPQKKLIYIQGTLQHPQYPFSSGIPEPLWLHSSNSSAMPIPIKLLSEMDALVVRGSARNMQIHLINNANTLDANSNPVAYAFLHLLIQNAGVLVEGKNLSIPYWHGLWNWEVIPLYDIPENHSFITSALTNSDIRFSYAEGIRAVFLK